VKNPCFLLLFALVAVICSCKDNQENDVPDKSSGDLVVFNDFIPSYPFDVPEMEMKTGKYDMPVAGKFNFEVLVDSMQSKMAYWKIIDFGENIVYQGHALNGKKDGWWEVIKDNILICSGNYASNTKYGIWRYYNLEEESKKFVNFINDTIVGLAQEFSADSTLLSEGFYVRGFKSDYWKYFYNNGILKEQGYFYDGYKNGWWQSFESNGNLIEEANYSNNEISGFTKKYFNGILFEEGESFDGQRRGTWKSYDETGNLKGIQEYGE